MPELPDRWSISVQLSYPNVVTTEFLPQTSESFPVWHEISGQGADRPRLNLEQFRTASRTGQPLCGRLSVR
jgi:hypothetical protein